MGPRQAPHWERGVSATGPPGKSLFFFFLHEYTLTVAVSNNTEVYRAKLKANTVPSTLRLRGHATHSSLYRFPAFFLDSYTTNHIWVHAHVDLDLDIKI